MSDKETQDSADLTAYKLKQALERQKELDRDIEALREEMAENSLLGEKINQLERTLNERFENFNKKVCEEIKELYEFKSAFLEITSITNYKEYIKILQDIKDVKNKVIGAAVLIQIIGAIVFVLIKLFVK